MKTRCFNTIRESVFVASVADPQLGQLHVRRLPMGETVSRYVVVRAEEVETAPFQVRVFAEVKTKQNCENVFISGPSLAPGTVNMLKDKIYSLMAYSVA